VELFDCISKNGDLSNVKGIGFKNNGDIKINEARELIRNLDDLPFPALDLMPMEMYFKAAHGERGQRQDCIYNDRWTTIITSRGCPMNCIFCSVHLTMGRLYRPRSPENVLSEIERDYNQFGIRHFNLEDDNATWSIERFERICDMIIEKKLNITWSAPNGLRADRVTDELVKKMKLSGCKKVYVASESGSQRVLDEVIDKKIKLKDVENAVELFAKNGVEVSVFFMMGLPGETKEEIWETINFAKRLRKKGASGASFSMATPQYGTRLYKVAVEKGYFDPNTDPTNFALFIANIQTPEFTREDLELLSATARWYVNLSLLQKLTTPLRYPKTLPYYIAYFMTNVGKMMGRTSPKHRMIEVNVKETPGSRPKAST
jgi:magnesium-protoporphyrin IX monomethyl ester (oxidative) cyclase